jgi:hypothetical protein
MQQGDIGHVSPVWNYITSEVVLYSTIVA